MSGRSIASLITLLMILITAGLIYLNEHVIIRNFETYIRDKIEVITSDLTHTIKYHLTRGEIEKVSEFIQSYKKFPDVKLISVFDSTGKVLCYIGEQMEIPDGAFLYQSEMLRYIPEKKIYEKVKPIYGENGKIGGIILKIEATPYLEKVKNTNLLIFTTIVILIVLGFLMILGAFNRRVLKPLTNVSGLMQDIGRGIYNVQLEAPKSSEIYDFAESFNQMVKLLDEKERRLERQKSQFKIIYEISRLGLEIKSIDEFFKNVVSLIRNEFKFLNVLYFSVDQSRKLKLTAVSGYLEDYLDETYTLEAGYGIPGSSVLIGDVIVINDVSKSPQFIPLYDAPIASEIAIPIRKKGKIIGVLDISSERTNAFTSEDVKIFKTIAETISIILEKFDSTMENIKLLFKLETVYKLTRDLVLERDIDKIFERAVKLIYSVLGKKELVVEIYERVNDMLVMKEIYGSLKEALPDKYAQSINEGIIGKAIRERKLIYVPDLILDSESKRYYKTTASEVVIPLIVKNEIVGAINCESEIVSAFDNVDLLVLQTIADTLSIAIQNARMYRQIFESESKYRAIFENSSEAIFRMDENGNLTDINPAFEKIFGFNPNDNVNFYDLFVSSEIAEKFKKEITSKGQVKGFDAQLKNKFENVLNVQISVKKLSEATGKTCYDGIIVDLTEYLKILDKVHEADKLRGLAQIAGGMAHEFNNIFAGILGSAQLIKMRVPKEEKIYYLADIIERSTTRGAELVKKLIGYARGGKFKITNANLNELVIDVLKKVQTSDKILIKTEFDPSIPDIVCDREQISQVLYDIILNGIEAMENGGTLTIKTEFGWYGENTVDDPEFKPGEYVKISISDTGIGMSDETMKRIFEPFFTTKRVLGKSGLGLSMAYGVIKNHNGFIKVSSSPGKGSTFELFLPVERRKEENIEEIEPVKTKLKILIIDDEEFLRMILADILYELGYDVIQAGDGVEGIRIYKEKKDEIDLVILDVIMPLMDGFETFKELKYINKDIKVIFTSGFAPDKKVRDLMAEEKNLRYVQKPYQVEEIERAIRSLFAEG